MCEFELAAELLEVVAHEALDHRRIERRVVVEHPRHQRLRDAGREVKDVAEIHLSASSVIASMPRTY